MIYGKNLYRGPLCTELLYAIIPTYFCLSAHYLFSIAFMLLNQHPIPSLAHSEVIILLTLQVHSSNLNHVCYTVTA